MPVGLCALTCLLERIDNVATPEQQAVRNQPTNLINKNEANVLLVYRYPVFELLGLTDQHAVMLPHAFDPVRCGSPYS